MPDGLVFLDTETTGLDPERHELWDIATIIDGREWNPLIRPEHLETADPTALRLMGYYDTFGSMGVKKGRELSSRNIIAALLAESLAGRHIVGAVPSFDAAFLSAFLRQHGYREAWHYHLVDVEALAAGKVGIQPPWDSEALSRAVGVEPTEFDRHTALGDARWVKAIYEAVMQPAAVLA